LKELSGDSWPALVRIARCSPAHSQASKMYADANVAKIKA